MKQIKFTLLTIALMLTASVVTLAPTTHLVSPVFAGELDLSDAQNAKLARHKVRERVDKNAKGDDYADDLGGNNETSDDEECGTVDIGNVVNKKGFGGPKKIDVIITGDIINANNDCD